MNKENSFLLNIRDKNGARQHRLKGVGPWLIGRGELPEIGLEETLCSRRHAEIYLSNNKFFIKDLGSTNGTRVNENLLEKEMPFQQGDVIVIGQARLSWANNRKKPAVTSSPQTSDKTPLKTSKNSTHKKAQPAISSTRRTSRPQRSPVGSILLIIGALSIAGFLIFDSTNSTTPQESTTVGLSSEATNKDITPDFKPVSIPIPKPLEITPPPVNTEEENTESKAILIQQRKSSFDEKSRFDFDFEDSESDAEESITDSSINEISPPRELAETLSFKIIDEAWPPSERVIAYEYHQKDHHGGPDFIDRRGGQITRRGSGNRKAFRVIALEVSNKEKSERLVQLTTPLRKDLEMRFRVPAGDSLRRYIAIEDPGDTAIRVEMLDEEGEILQSIERVIASGHRTENLREALAVAKEREREEWIRKQFKLRPIEVQVLDEGRNPVAGAQLILLNKESLAVVEGKTNANGFWSSMVVPGAWTVVAHGEIEDEIDPDATTAVFRLPRVFLLQNTLAEDADSLILVPQKDTEISVMDENDKPLSVEKVWITPESVAQAFTTERVAREVGSRARLETQKQVPSGRFRLLLSGIAVELCVLGRTSDGEPVLLRQRTAGDRQVVPVRFSKSVMGRLEYSSASAFGGASDGRIEIVSIDGFRERFSLETKDARRAWVFPGTYRLEVRSQLPGGKSARFLPYRVSVANAGKIDLEPRGPWKSILHYERKDGTLQMRLSLSDANGRVLDSVPSGVGSLAAVDSRGTVLIERELGSMRWQEPRTLDRVDLSKIRIQVDVPYGDSAIQGIAIAEPPITVNDAGSSASGPSVFRQRMTDMMPEVSRSLEGCRVHLGCADGVQRLFMDFDIFMPPGVGGLGGGGVIVLDAAVLHEYTGIGDILPGPYTHELGHNIGFGHDPYMLLADSGVDEGIYGELGYRLLNMSAFQQTMDWLLNRSSDRMQPWQPNASVFAAMRFLHGLGVHHKMFTERRASEVTLLLHGLSSIERIAALYSLALGQNVAWIFRANGWPVFDDRIDLGGSSVKFIKSHPKKLNYNRIDGTIINGWWVRGPVEGKTDEANSSWKRTVWPTPFTDLASDLDPATETRQWILFRRIAVNKDMEARLAVATDVKLQIRVNGSPVGFVDASAQMFQPMHDELMLNQKKPFPVTLLKGENVIEIAATQIRGTRGFRIELMTPDGTPVPMGVLDEGPPGEPLLDDVVRVENHTPLLNGDFESPEYLDGWINGEVDPGGSIQFRPETEVIGTGTCALRAEVREPGAGGIIQRIVVTPGKRYEISAIMRSEGFRGEAHLGFFTGRLGSWTGRSKPLRTDSDWRRVKFEWSPGQSRTTYLACFVQGLEGTVWFDEIEFKELP